MKNSKKETNTAKKNKIDQFLSEEYVLLHIDTKNSALKIPLHLRQGPSVVLKISRYFRGEMNLTDDGVIADLLFSGSYFTCEIPYESIWGITSSKGVNFFWPESTPKDVLSDVFANTKTELPNKPNSENQPVRPEKGLYCISSQKDSFISLKNDKEINKTSTGKATLKLIKSQSKE